MARTSAQPILQWKDLKPYVSPPVEAKVRGVLMSSGNHRVQVIVPEQALFDVQALQRITKIEQMSGIGRKMPLTMGAFTIAGLSLIGVPGTVGFVSKWYLALAAFEHGWWWLAGAIVLSSLIAVVYIGRIIEVAYFRDVTAQPITANQVPPEMIGVTWALALATVYFGIDTELTARVAGQAADVLLAGLK